MGNWELRPFPRSLFPVPSSLTRAMGQGDYKIEPATGMVLGAGETLRPHMLVRWSEIAAHFPDLAADAEFARNFAQERARNLLYQFVKGIFLAKRNLFRSREFHSFAPAIAGVLEEALASVGRLRDQLEGGASAGHIVAYVHGSLSTLDYTKQRRNNYPTTTRQRRVPVTFLRVAGEFREEEWAAIEEASRPSSE